MNGQFDVLGATWRVLLTHWTLPLGLSSKLPAERGEKCGQIQVTGVVFG